MTLLTGTINNGISRGTDFMYVEFESNKLVNTNFFGRVTKKDKTEEGTTTYSIVYELLNGEVLSQDFDNQSDRDAAYNQLLA